MTTRFWRVVAILPMALAFVLTTVYHESLAWSWSELIKMLDGTISGTTIEKRIYREAKSAFKEREYQTAMDLVQQAIKIDPNMPSAHWLMVRLGRQSNQQSLQLKHLNHLEKLDSLNADLYLGQARIYRSQNQHKLAGQTLLRGIDIIEKWLDLYKPRPDSAFGNRYNDKILSDYRAAGKAHKRLQRALRTP